MDNVVENPILNSLFEEPARYHHFASGEGRRPAQYLMARLNSDGHCASMEDWPTAH